MTRSLLLATCLLLGACAPVDDPPPTPKPSAFVPRSEASSNYRVVEDKKTGNIKRSVTVVLEDKLEEDERQKIADKIKRSDGQNYERTFIEYYIKQKNDGNVWATTHYSPDLQVIILGLTRADESNLSKLEPSSSDKKVIGTWLDDWSFIGSKITVYYSKDGKLIFENIYSDGSSTTEMVESNDPRGKKLEAARGNSIGEYYIINASNQLEFWGKNGNYYTARSLD
jgi:hypothetical protein